MIMSIKIDIVSNKVIRFSKKGGAITKLET